jgi:translation initiation factor 2 beta subunit (eIF-2beta)/eIF-5
LIGFPFGMGKSPLKVSLKCKDCKSYIHNENKRGTCIFTTCSTCINLLMKVMNNMLSKILS